MVAYEEQVRFKNQRALNTSVHTLKMLRKYKGHLPTVAETWMVLFQAPKHDSIKLIPRPVVSYFSQVVYRN